MINPTQIHGKCLAMIAWAKTADGENDVTVFTGIAHWDGNQLTMRRKPIDSSFEIEPKWIERIEKVSAELKETLLGAEYSFSVSVGDVSEADSPSELKKTGLRWPKK